MPALEGVGDDVRVGEDVTLGVGVIDAVGVAEKVAAPEPDELSVAKPAVAVPALEVVGLVDQELKRREPDTRGVRLTAERVAISDRERLAQPDKCADWDAVSAYVEEGGREADGDDWRDELRASGVRDGGRETDAADVVVRPPAVGVARRASDPDGMRDTAESLDADVVNDTVGVSLGAKGERLRLAVAEKFARVVEPRGDKDAAAPEGETDAELDGDENGEPGGDTLGEWERAACAVAALEMLAQ